MVGEREGATLTPYDSRSAQRRFDRVKRSPLINYIFEL